MEDTIDRYSYLSVKSLEIKEQIACLEDKLSKESTLELKYERNRLRHKYDGLLEELKIVGNELVVQYDSSKLIELEKLLVEQFKLMNSDGYEIPKCSCGNELIVKQVKEIVSYFKIQSCGMTEKINKYGENTSSLFMCENCKKRFKIESDKRLRHFRGEEIDV